MSSLYPAALDATGTTFPVRADGTTTTAQHAADHNNLADAIIKIETELGINPKGSFATVLARLAGFSRTGTLASIGAAASYSGGRYFATDVGAEYLSDGASWIRISAPAGELVSYPGLTLPASLVRAYGQAVSRTGIYAEVFAAHTTTASGTGNSGQAVLTFSATPEGVDTGTKIEGTGVNAAATVLSVTSTTVTLTHNLTTSGARTVRFLPHGGGDGSTTFNLPDARGKGAFGRDNMGGSQAAATYRTGSVLGAVGGTITHTLSASESGMPTHLHSITDPGHGHSLSGSITTSGGHGHSIAVDGGLNQYAASASHTHGFAAWSGDANSSLSNTAVGGTGVRTNAVHQHFVYGTTDPPSGSNYLWHNHTASTTSDGSHTHSHTLAASSTSTGITGTQNATGVAASSAHENRPPFIITDQCIRL
jgi:microcystin-dependent protein